MILSTARAFAPVARPVSQSLSSISTASSRSTHLQVLPSPADFHSVVDMTALNHAAQEFLSSSSVILSDAAGATMDAAAEAVDSSSGGGGPGWWQSYLQIFRNILVAVHDTVDAPLKSAGVEQTWGISIALFTMGKLVPC